MTPVGRAMERGAKKSAQYLLQTGKFSCKPNLNVNSHGFLNNTAKFPCSQSLTVYYLIAYNSERKDRFRGGIYVQCRYWWQLSSSPGCEQRRVGGKPGCSNSFSPNLQRLTLTQKKKIYKKATVFSLQPTPHSIQKVHDCQQFPLKELSRGVLGYFGHVRNYL